MAFSFGTTQAQPSSLFAPATSTLSPPSITLTAPSVGGGNPAAPGVSNNPNPPSGSSSAQIDLEHLRPTTKFDQLLPALQSEITALDTHILAQITNAHEVSDLLPIIAGTITSIPPDVEYVTGKLSSVEIALENDASEIVDLRDKILRKDAREAQLCFRSVDRLKMPAHYQNQTANVVGSGEGSYGVYGGSGLSGWWNHPQTLQRNMRSTTGARGSKTTLQLPSDTDDEESGPNTLLELFSSRADQMRATLKSNRELLGEIETFVSGVEGKILQKERQLNDSGNGMETEKPDDQRRLLRYVFGEVERSLYDVADKVGGCRDGVQELVMAEADGGMQQRW